MARAGGAGALCGSCGDLSCVIVAGNGILAATSELLVHDLGLNFVSVNGSKVFMSLLKKNQNAPRPSEHPPVREEKCQNV